MLSFINDLKQKVYLQAFTVYLRYLIGGAFIIAAFGMGKVRGKANLLHSLDHPIEQLAPMQQFFRVMVDSGFYWQFIGWSQIIAASLVMTQRFARLGALIFFVIILNIFVITVSYDFTGNTHCYRTHVAWRPLFADLGFRSLPTVNTKSVFLFACAFKVG